MNCKPHTLVALAALALLTCCGQNSLAAPAERTVNVPDLVTYYSSEELWQIAIFRVSAAQLNCRREPHLNGAIDRIYRKGELVYLGQIENGNVTFSTERKVWMRTADGCWAAANRSLLAPAR